MSEVTKVMPTQTEQTVSVLNELIEICIDGSQGYKKAAEDVKEMSLKTLFLGYATQRDKFAAELKSLVTANGGKPSESGHAAGAFHRGWMSVKEAIGDTDKAIIDECEAGEDRAMKAYKDAIAQAIPGVSGEFITKQFAGIQEAHNRLRDLKHSRN